MVNIDFEPLDLKDESETFQNGNFRSRHQFNWSALENQDRRLRTAFYSRENEVNDNMQNIEDRVNAQLTEGTLKDEEIDARHSDMLTKTFSTMRARGDFWDNELKARGLNVKWFGAVGDGVTDDTNAIQQAIDYFKTSNFKNIIFEGNFLISKAGEGTDGRDYAIKFDGLSDQNIDLRRAEFTTGAVDEFPNMLAFYNCENIKIAGGYAHPDISALKTARPLYSGAFIYAYNCNYLYIDGAKSFNANYLACLFNSNNGSVRNTVFSYDQQDTDEIFCPNSAILLYSTSHYLVFGNDITGGLRDGDLSVFGSGSFNNVVLGNHLRGLRWEEAITVDGGAVKTVVTNNIVEGGYNYAIEAKYNSENTLITGNLIQKCVVGISVRGGEIGEASVFNTVITNNTIIFGDVPETQGWDGMRQTGILYTDAFSAHIANNHLTLGNGANVSYVINGIYLKPIVSQSYDYYSAFEIANNYIELQNGKDANFNTAGTNSCCLIIDSMSSAKISNNFVKAPAGLLAVKILNANQEIFFQGNNFLTDGVIPIQYYGNASCNKLTITTDNMYSASRIANAYMWRTNIAQDTLSLVINDKTFGSSGFNQFLQLSSTSDLGLIIKVKMFYDYGGSFCAESTYKIYLTKTGITLLPISENNIDVKIATFYNGNGISAIGIQASRDCPNSKINFHVSIYGETGQVSLS